MKKQLFIICSILSEISAVLLMILTKAYVVKWADPVVIRTTAFSYFSLVPYGYGHFTPFLTAILAVISIVLLLIGLKYKKAVKINFIISLLCVLASVISLFTSYTFTITSLLISLLLALSLVFHQIQKIKNMNC